MKKGHPIRAVFPLLARTYMFLDAMMPYGFTYGLRRIVSKSNFVLDIGCGPDSPLRHVSRSKGHFVGIDIFGPYVHEAARRRMHEQLVLCDARLLPFKRKSFDVALALDVIEHMPKNDALNLMKEMESLARGYVAIVTPNGSLDQGVYDENPFQAHRSGWSRSELANLGYKTRGIRGINMLRGLGANPKISPPAIGLLVAGLLEIFGWLFPSVAFQLLATKKSPASVISRIVQVSRNTR